MDGAKRGWHHLPASVESWGRCTAAAALPTAAHPTCPTTSVHLLLSGISQGKNVFCSGEWWWREVHGFACNPGCASLAACPYCTQSHPTHSPPLPLPLPCPAGQVTTADSEIIMFGGHSQDIEW